MTRLESWALGVSCHAYRNRRFFLFLLLIVPLVTAAAMQLMNAPSDVREGMVLR